MKTEGRLIPFVTYRKKEKVERYTTGIKRKLDMMQSVKKLQYKPVQRVKEK